jgi:Transposase DDE domain group 1
LVLVRELDERLGFEELIEEYLADSRRGKNTQFPLADLFRQSVYSRLAGYEDVNDTERLCHDPTFRLIGSARIWDRGAALTSRLQTFETEMLAEEEKKRENFRCSEVVLAGKCHQRGRLGAGNNHGRHRKGRTSRYATPNRLCGFQLDSWGAWVYGFRPRGSSISEIAISGGGAYRSACRKVWRATPGWQS